MKKLVIAGSMIFALAAGNAIAADCSSSNQIHHNTATTELSSPGEKVIRPERPDMSSAYVPGKVNFFARSGDIAQDPRY